MLDKCAEGNREKQTTRKKSTNDQGNSTATHVEMWRERQGRTPDGGRQEGTRETIQHMRMGEGTYTPIRSQAGVLMLHNRADRVLVRQLCKSTSNSYCLFGVKPSF